MKKSPEYRQSIHRRYLKRYMSIRTVFKQILLIKEMCLVLDKNMRIAYIQNVPVDNKMKDLGKKVENDTDIIGPELFALGDMNTLTNEIIENENHIKTLMKKKQDD
jgi:hypothetical protein